MRELKLKTSRLNKPMKTLFVYIATRLLEENVNITKRAFAH